MNTNQLETMTATLENIPANLTALRGKTIKAPSGRVYFVKNVGVSEGRSGESIHSLKVAERYYLGYTGDHSPVTVWGYKSPIFIDPSGCKITR